MITSEKIVIPVIILIVGIYVGAFVGFAIGAFHYKRQKTYWKARGYAEKNIELGRIIKEQQHLIEKYRHEALTRHEVNKKMLAYLHRLNINTTQIYEPVVNVDPRIPMERFVQNTIVIPEARLGFRTVVAEPEMLDAEYQSILAKVKELGGED